MMKIVVAFVFMICNTEFTPRRCSMLEYVAFYLFSVGFLIIKFYATYLRKAPVIESEEIIRQYTTLAREKAKRF